VTAFAKRIGLWITILAVGILACLVLNNLINWNNDLALSCARRDTEIDANTGRGRKVVYIANIKVKETILENDFSRKLQQLNAVVSDADWRHVISSPLLCPQPSASVYGNGFRWQSVILDNLESGKFDKELHRQIANTYLSTFKSGNFSEVDGYVSAVCALANGQKVISLSNAPTWLLTGSNVPPVTEAMIRGN
jgi:hypothetical protein